MKYFHKDHPENRTIKFINRDYHIRQIDKWTCITKSSVLMQIYDTNIKEMIDRFCMVKTNHQLEFYDIVHRLCDGSNRRQIMNDIHDIIINIEYINT